MYHNLKYGRNVAAAKTRRRTIDVTSRGDVVSPTTPGGTEQRVHPRNRVQSVALPHQRERKLTYRDSTNHQHVSNRKNFRIKYYERMNIVRLQSVSQDSRGLTTEGKHVAIENNVSRGNFDWAEPDFSFVTPPVSPTNTDEFGGIFELEL